MLSILIFTSCEKKSKLSENKKTTFYYPNNKTFEADSSKVFIELDSFSSFYKLLEHIDNISCEMKTPVLIYENEKSIFNLIPIHMCSNEMMIWCPKARNELTITKDSIITNYNTNISLDSLANYTTRHIKNNGKENGLSDSPEKAFFSILRDSLLSISRTKEILLEISENFNKINIRNGDSLPLHILIGSEKIEMIKPPPPPPNVILNN